jgi:transcriptional regulator with XRE-family HTH domain
MRSTDIGTRIAVLRRRRKWSQAALAKKVNVTQNYISQIEKNRKLPSLSLIATLADALGVKIATLVEDDPLLSDLRQLVDRDGLDALLASVSKLLSTSD